MTRNSNALRFWVAPGGGTFIVLEDFTGRYYPAQWRTWDSHCADMRWFVQEGRALMEHIISPAGQKVLGEQLIAEHNECVKETQILKYMDSLKPVK